MRKKVKKKFSQKLYCFILHVTTSAAEVYRGLAAEMFRNSCKTISDRVYM